MARPLEFAVKERQFALYSNDRDQVVGIIVGGVSKVAIQCHGKINQSPLRNLVLASAGLSVVETARLTYRSPEAVKSGRLQASRALGANNMGLAATMAFHTGIYDVMEPLEPLTLQPRQHDVLKYAARGLTKDQTATELGIAPSNVQTHQKNLLTSIGAANVVQAVFLASLSGQLPGKP